MGTYLFSVLARSGATIRTQRTRLTQCLPGAVGRPGRLARGKSATSMGILFQPVHFLVSAMGLAPRFCQMEMFSSRVETLLLGRGRYGVQLVPWYRKDPCSTVTAEATP